MRLGSDALKLPGATTLTAPEQLQQAAEHGLGGLFFRTMLHLSPTLDPGLLREVRSTADRLGLYLESGLGKVNPYGLPESPELRALGDGDTVAGFRRMMEAAAAIGITELWVATAGIKPYSGRLCYDRYRTDVTWTDQLAATAKFCTILAPIARDLGLHLNAETHEEITSFELVRLVEEVGPDVMGITYDTANPLQRAEHPARTAQRVAPYVRQTHLKDAALVHDPHGMRDQMRPNGQGVVDLHWILPALYAANPGLNLSLEIAEVGISSAPQLATRAKDARTGIALYDPIWLDGHPDLTVTELVEYLGLARAFENRIAAGEVPSLAEVSARGFTAEDAWKWVDDSFAYIREVLRDSGIPCDD
ncbi:sugar phosphate isomerase/epimerase family protein [Kribbella sp. NPDC004875]|uniref:sugar phosphate isomerase/epimerase family protein n=1 Tax=Kribbella sp. NPDC004875 TaxID=3364107 RepID=UPI003697E207